jgi:hypothetical protein
MLCIVLFNHQCVSIPLLSLLKRPRPNKKDTQRPHLSQQLFQDYCKKNAVSKTIPTSQRVALCPQFHLMQAMKAWDCLNASISTAVSSEERLDLSLLVSLFFDKMRKDGSKIAFVGDSLSYQMYHMALCLQEYAHSSSTGAGDLATSTGTDVTQDVFMLARSNYLVPIPQHIHLKAEPYSRSELEATWWVEVIQNDPAVKYIVLNTGAWWHGNRLRQKKNPNHGLKLPEILTVFEEHFSDRGELYRKLSFLQKDCNKTLIWRDLAPGGTCDLSKRDISVNKYNKQYSIYTQINAIAHRAMNQLGGHIIPRILETSLPQWTDHPSIVGEKDVLHWCNYERNSVPSIWNQRLFQLILEIL